MNPNSMSEYEAANYTLTALLFEAVIEMGAEKSKIAGRLRTARDNFQVASQPNAASTVEMLMRQLKLR